MLPPIFVVYQSNFFIFFCLIMFSYHIFAWFQVYVQGLICRHSTKLLWLGDKRWERATCMYKSGKCWLIDFARLLLFNVQYVQWSSIWKREVSTGSSQYRMHQRVSARMAKRALPPRSLRIHNTSCCGGCIDWRASGWLRSSARLSHPSYSTPVFPCLLSAVTTFSPRNYLDDNTGLLKRKGVPWIASLDTFLSVARLLQQRPKALHEEAYSNRLKITPGKARHAVV